MNNKKVVFIDYDGTLYSEKHKRPSYRIIELLVLAKNNNIDIYLSTGRTLLTLAHEKSILENIKGVLGANGSFIYSEGKMISINYISKSMLIDLYKYTKENNINIAFFSKTYAYTSFCDNTLLDRFKTFNKVNVIDIYNSYEIVEEIELVCLYEEDAKIDVLAQKFPKLTIYKWGTWGSDVVNKGCTKGRAITDVIKLYGYDFNNTYGIGDGLNDIEMFNSVNHSIAMGNASDYVKKHAKHVTSNIEDDGLEEVLEDIIYGKM